MADTKQYEAAMKVINQKKDIYRLGEALQCMDNDCYGLNHYNNSYQKAAYVCEGIEYLIDEKNDFLSTARRCISRFEPQESADSFVTYIAQVQALLNKCKIGYSEELEKELNRVLDKFQKELGRINGEIKALNHFSYCNAIKEGDDALGPRARAILDIQNKCLTSRCGWLGHGNPAIKVILSCERLVAGIYELNQAVAVVSEFVSKITQEMEDANNLLIVLKDMSPARNPQEGIKQINSLKEQWEKLIQLLKS